MMTGIVGINPVDRLCYKRGDRLTLATAWRLRPEVNRDSKLFHRLDEADDRARLAKIAATAFRRNSGKTGWNRAEAVREAIRGLVDRK
jgi:hypothetical protein